MRVLVIGGTQFMGLEAVKRLVLEDHEVTVFHRGNRCDLVPTRVDHIHGDSLELTKYRGELAAFSPDAVLDMALEKGADAQQLVATLTGMTRRLLAVSSANVYRSYSLLHGWEQSDEPYRIADPEAGPLRQHRIPDDDPHDEKIDVEDVVMNATGLDASVVRLPAVHGPNDPLNRGYEYLWRMDAGRPHIVMNDVFGSWRWSRGYVDNMVDALLLVLTADTAVGRIYNVSDPEALTQADWIRAIGAAAGWDGEVISTPAVPASTRTDYQHHFLTDSSAIRNHLGYRDGLMMKEWIPRMVEWLRSNPPPEARAAEIRATRQLSFEAEDEIAGRYRSL